MSDLSAFSDAKCGEEDTKAVHADIADVEIGGKSDRKRTLTSM